MFRLLGREYAEMARVRRLEYLLCGVRRGAVSLPYDNGYDPAFLDDCIVATERKSGTVRR